MCLGSGIDSVPVSGAGEEGWSALLGEVREKSEGWRSKEGLIVVLWEVVVGEEWGDRRA